MSKPVLGFFSRLVLILLACAVIYPAWAGVKKKMKSTLRLQSKSFTMGGKIPDQYTCKGQNISPELNWKGAPAKTKSFALIVDDPDAPSQTWVHWVIYNVPVKPAGVEENVYELLEGFPRDDKTTGGILQGSNDFKKIGYDGPCPPTGIHRYYFHLYALDTVLNLPAEAMKSLLLHAMKGHILDQTQLMGTYGK